MTRMQRISEKVLELWNDWEVRGMVLLSLTLQIILIIFGSRRKYITSSWLRILVWLVYLSADMAATVALGNLARSQGECGGCSTKPNNLIQVFWAPFFLLHLGGPDTITAYSLEDNELWLRHLLNLGIQVQVAFYVLVKSWGSTTLTFLAIPVFITGIIKYGERNWVLKSSAAKNIRDSLLSVRPVFRGNLISIVPRERNVPVINYLHEGHFLFKMSKYLFEGLLLGFSELQDSHSIISVKSSAEAFKLVEVELGFMYDMLYTKVPIIYSYLGIFFRCISFLFSTSALVAFSVIIKKHDYAFADIVVTYLLLVGALVLEVYAIFYLIFSDRTMIWLTRNKNPPTYSISGAIYSLHSHLTSGRRWSGSIAQHNLISYCLKTKSATWVEKLGIDEMLKHLYITWDEVNAELKEMIFRQLLNKGHQIITHIDDADLRYKLVAQRGDGVLEERQDFLWSISTVEFNQSLLTWHIATDLCYYHDHLANNRSLKRKISKCLSDYMCYLLSLRPDMLPKGVGDIGNRYRDTCNEFKKWSDMWPKKTYSEEEACSKLLEYDLRMWDMIRVNMETYGYIRGDSSTLFDGCKLVMQLQSLEFEAKWELICEVWIEMLSYAASHCEWKEHAQQLRRGGELLTHVCLLMAHLGLSQQYQPTRLEKLSEQERQQEGRRH